MGQAFIQQGAAMDAINSFIASALKEGFHALKKVATPSDTSNKNAAPVTKDSKEFDATLKAFLSVDGENKVSEEDVFSALIQERIKGQKGEAALKTFQDLLSKSKGSLKKPDGFIPVEEATKDALRKFRDSGAISKEDVDKIYSQSFAGAQLDSNKDALYDNRGGPGDSSVAVASLEQALLSSRTLVAAFDGGTETATERSLDEVSAGKPSGGGAGHVSEPGAGGFLFKPVSDSDGKLAVLLPPKLAGLVSGVRLLGPGGDLLEAGRYAGNGNGGRDHYRFSRPGGNYADGLTVEVTLKTGELVRYIIQETSQRTENVSPSNGSSGSGGSQTDDNSSSSGSDSSQDNAL